VSTSVVAAEDHRAKHGDAPFRDHVVVFTGKLACLARQAAQGRVRELGGEIADEVTQRTTLLVVGEEGFLSKIDKSRKLRTAERRVPRVQIISEEEFCRRADLLTAGDLKQTLYSLRDIRKVYAELRDDRVRYLEARGLVSARVKTNAERFYDFPTLLVLRRAHQELSEGQTLRAVVQSLRAERTGQLRLDFAPRAIPARVVTFRRPGGKPIESPQTWFDRGFELDEDPWTRLEAQRAYERALELDPNYVPALINLGNLHYGEGRSDEARACFERAMAHEPGNAKARFNLANVLHDRHEYQAALILYRDAVGLAPDFADAYFNLALTCEELELVDEAQRYWRRYLHLDPMGEWAAIAREHLSAGTR
jgi:tetratricopeptide (TPR) repeat protein